MVQFYSSPLGGTKVSGHLGKSEEEEEELDVLSNQRKLCCKHCAGVVVLEFHVLYVVVSGGGHRR